MADTKNCFGIKKSLDSMFSWDDFKKKYEVNPFSLFDPKQKRTNPEKAIERLDTCFSCEKFINLTKQCRECWCFMPAKVLIHKAECPLGKWGN